MGGKSRAERKAARRRKRRGETASEAERKALASYLTERDMQMVEVAEDGNCLFRSFATQIYGRPDYHPVTRRHCGEVLASRKEEYALFLDEDV